MMSLKRGIFELRDGNVLASQKNVPRWENVGVNKQHGDELCARNFWFREFFIPHVVDTTLR